MPELSNTLALVELAVGHSCPVEALQNLMVFHSTSEDRRAKTDFFASKCKLQNTMPVIKKQKTAKFPTKNGGQMEYKYASLDDIAESVKPLLAEYGFSYRWEQNFGNEGGIRIRCVLTHSSGHSEQCEMVGGADTTGNKNSLQAIASTITYLRRYTLTGVLGIATADEDIDGRLPPGETTASSEINDRLEEDADIANCVSMHISTASTLQELKDTKELVNDLKDGIYKERCKAEYMERLKELKKSKEATE